jgi:hypothetical protein
LNRALAETQLVTIGHANSDDVAAHLVSLREILGDLHHDDEFLDNIQRATGDRTRTQGRMNLYAEAFENAGVRIAL